MQTRPQISARAARRDLQFFARVRGDYNLSPFCDVTSTDAKAAAPSPHSLGSLNKSIFERRTSTGSGLFASLGSGLVKTFG